MRRMVLTQEDAPGLRALADEFQLTGRRLVFAGAPDTVRNALREAGLGGAGRFTDSVEDARRSLES